MNSGIWASIVHDAGGGPESHWSFMRILESRHESQDGTQRMGSTDLESKGLNRLRKQGGDSQGALFCYLLMRTTCLLRHIPRHMMPLRHPYKRGKRSYEKHELLLSPSLRTGLKFP